MAANVAASSTHMVFARLDPVLKQLLEGLTSLKGLLPALSVDGPPNKNDDQLESTFVRLCKSLANELELLPKAMELEFSSSKQHQQRLQHAKALCLLQKYIALPLNAIFRLPLKETFAPPSKSNATEHNPRLAIRRSYVYKLYHLAAVAMQRFLEETTIVAEAAATKQNSSKNLLPMATWVEHLVALVHSMPTYTEITTAGKTSSLDDGSNAFCAILEATKTLLACFDNTTTATTVLLVEAWHGTLSMRLVDCLTAFLVPEVFSPNVHQRALETLLTMLTVTKAGARHGSSNSKNGAASQSKSFWRSVFPGVFTALYQRITNDPTNSRSKTLSSVNQTKVQIKTLSIQSLILLLQITLSIKDSENKKDDSVEISASETTDSKPNNSNDDLLAKLTSMVITANENNINTDEEKMHSNPNTEKNPTNNSNDKEEEQFFYDQVRKRVEGPLVFLLRQLSLSSVDDIRRNVVVLCKVILFETRNCWATDITATTSSTSPGNLMEKIPLELCIGFQQDPNDLVRISAKEVIDTYTGIRNVDSPSNFSSSPSRSVWMVPRIIELVQKLSTLVHRGKTTTSNIKSGIANNITTATELRTDLNLLAGYLQCLDTASYENNGVTAKELRAMSTSMRNAIVSSKNLRQGLIQLFDVDLDSLSSKNGSLVSLIIDHQSKSPIKLRHLDHPDLMVLARDSILRSLGRLLGPKHGAIFVDEVLSDFLEASFHMPKASPSSTDLFAAWLHKWIGSLIVAREVLLGSFSVSTTSTVSIDKKEMRRRRILLSLASSILPLLIDSSLWNLPIDNRIFTTKSVATNANDTVLSTQTLQRNQIVVILLMELIGIFCQLLQEDLKEVLVTVFYQIVEKTTRRGPQTSSDIIQHTGLSTLKIMSSSCGLESTEGLIHAEQNRLIASMIGRLRLPGGSSIPNNRGEAEEILSVTKILIWVLEMINRRADNKKNIINNEKGDTIEKDSNPTKNSAVMELVALLNYRLDHLFLQKALVDADVETVCSLHKEFFNYFLHLFDVEEEKTYSYQMKHLEKDSKQPWLDLLSQFRKLPLDTQEMDDDDEKKECEGRLLDFAKSDIALFAKLIGRNCYLLSYQKLQSRISSCDALTTAFKFLAFVGSEHDDPTDDTNVIRNTILRQVADSWPSIRARLKSLSEVILQSYSGRSSKLVLVLNQSNARENKKSEDIGTQRIFLSKLFQLIATMCECSGDFFADRFRNDVWPVMARHLEYLLQELQRQREAHSSATAIASEQMSIKAIPSPISSEKTSIALSNQKRLSFKMSDTQEQLMASILRCLNRILEQEECGKAVEKLLDTIGSTLLPLLDIEDQAKIQDPSMDCIRSILKIDSDVLRRPLMELSGTKIQPCPLKFKRDYFDTSSEKIVEMVTHDFSLSVVSAGDKASTSTTIGNRCRELLTFAESLPEQAI